MVIGAKSATILSGFSGNSHPIKSRCVLPEPSLLALSEKLIMYPFVLKSSDLWCQPPLRNMFVIGDP